MIEKALELEPESAEAYAALGLSRLVVGRKEEAEMALRKAIELNPDYIPAYVWSSAMLSDLGRAPEAGEVLLQAMAKDPLNEILAINYSENLQLRGDNDGAREVLETLLRMQPDHVGLLSALSETELKSGNLEQAWMAAWRAFVLEPENVVVINVMAKAWMELGETEQAEEVWMRGIASNPKSVELKVQYLTMLLVEGRAEDAEGVIEQLFPADITTIAIGFQRTYHYFMGLLQGVKENYPGMRDHFERVIDPVVDQLYDRNQIFVLTTASLINHHLGEAEKAEKQLLTAERVVGHARVDGIDDAAIYYSASCLFAMRGDVDRALLALQQSVERGFRQAWLLRQDGRIDSLRDHPEFQEIQQFIDDEVAMARVAVQGLRKDSEVSRKLVSSG